MKKNIIAIIVVLLIAIGVCVLSYSLRTNRIESWATKHNYTILNKEQCWTTIGTPYYFKSKGEMIFKVIVRNSQNQTEIWYVRTGNFYNDYEK